MHGAMIGQLCLPSHNGGDDGDLARGWGVARHAVDMAALVDMFGEGGVGGVWPGSPCGGFGSQGKHFAAAKKNRF